MNIRPAQDSDLPIIRSLSEKFDLDSKEMPADEFIVVEENKRIIGYGRLLKHTDCFELSSLGVVKEFQKQGIGKALTQEIIQQAKDKPLYLRSIIPDFFQKLGFQKINNPPKSLRQDPEWCEGCDPSRCVAMKYEHT